MFRSIEFESIIFDMQFSERSPELNSVQRAEEGSDSNQSAKRIFISGIDSFLGYHLVEKLRTDHLSIENYNIISGTAASHREQSKDSGLEKAQLLQEYRHESVSQFFEIDRTQTERDLALKFALQSDVAILDLRSDSIPRQVEMILNVLPHRKAQSKPLKVIGISDYLTWAGGCSLANDCSGEANSIQSVLSESASRPQDGRLSADGKAWISRVPHPVAAYNHELQNSLLRLNFISGANIESKVLCCGILYGEDSPDFAPYIASAFQLKKVPRPRNGFAHFLKVNLLLEVTESIVNNKATFPEYSVLCEEEPVSLDQVLGALQRGNSVFIQDTGSCLREPALDQDSSESAKQVDPLDYDQIRWNVSTKFTPSQKLKQICSDGRSQNPSILNDVAVWAEEFLRYWSFEPKRVLLPVECLETENGGAQLESAIRQKGVKILDKEALNAIVLELLQEGSIEQKVRETEQKGKSSKIDRKSSKVELHEEFAKEGVERFIDSNPRSHFVILLREDSIQKILQEVSSLAQSWVRVVSQQRFQEQESMNESVICFDTNALMNKFNITQLEGLETNLQENPSSEVQMHDSLTNISQQEKEEAEKLKEKSEQVKSRNEEAQKENENPIDPIKQKMKRHKSEICDSNGTPINLLNQYLLDNLLVYVSEARQKKSEKNNNRGQKFESPEFEIREFIFELQKIRKRQSQFCESA